jgi:hypothetical protein
LAIFGHFLVIFGHFWSFFGHFWPFLIIFIDFGHFGSIWVYLGPLPPYGSIRRGGRGLDLIG